MKTEFKNGDTVILGDDGNEYFFIGMSKSDTHGLNCVIEGYERILYANTSKLTLKPEPFRHPGGEYPKPLSEVESGVCCWLPKAGVEDNVIQIVYPRSTNEYLYHRLLKMGLLHKTKEAAMAHAKVIYRIED